MSKKAAEPDDLIAAHPCRFVDWHRVETFEHDMALGADHEECRCEVDFVKPFEVQITSVHDIERAGFEDQLVEDIDVVNFAISDNDDRRNIAA